ncbi:DUF1501 domain-containing protein [Polynucleobacter sp. JS-Safj-400b-B2]|uniref:DUF1501 domain-containing protein n=1 Tax=Polynucleobacter sp. JS-Safj-400b-B2 TaxID=2576921 RepID=UPI001C0C95C9|nr:DUF1501 domain-containing protein [Polynucleobacter sp. JS-Safj-400b-B2]MBU3627214.1 DUF1501 domain-containing protein [Polynucleobacter sp. JS-Safj-400b-B2]
MKRRTFLKASATSTLSAAAQLGLGGMYAGISKWSFAASPEQANIINKSINGGPLIVVFLRGGADGLAILSPLDDPNFLAARPPEMRFTKEKAANSAPITLDGTNFYWHPAAAPLNQLFSNRRLIAWPTVGIKDETRSHFEAQEIIERGIQNLQTLPDSFGWMARQVYLNKGQISPKVNSLPLFAGSNTMPRAMQGANQVLAVRDLQGGISFQGGQASLKAIQTLAEVDNNHPAAQTMLGNFASLEQVNNALPKTDNKVLPYTSSGQVPYPDTDPGVGLRSVARIMQTNLGLQYAWVDYGGWDTHDAQPGRINNQIERLSKALLAFDEDMRAQNKDYKLVVMTEFGRRLISNKSNGTDHGHGSLALIMGSQVAGGRMMGRWPGLETNQLDRGVDLAVTTDYLQLLKNA